MITWHEEAARSCSTPRRITNQTIRTTTWSDSGLWLHASGSCPGFLWTGSQYSSKMMCDDDQLFNRPSSAPPSSVLNDCSVVGASNKRTWDYSTEKPWVKSARNGNSKTKYIECCAWLKILMVYNNCGWTVGEGEMICLSICRWMRMMMIIIVGGRKTNRGLWLLTTSIELSLVLSFVLWRRWWWWWFLLTIYVLWRWSTDRPSDLSSAVQPSGMGGDGHWEFCSDHEFDLMPLDSWNVVGSQFWEDSGLWK